MAQAQLSAVIPVRGEHHDLADTFCAWRTALEATGRRYEMIWAFDGRRDDLRHTLVALKGTDRHVKLLGLARWQGEAAAIHAALRHAEGEVILTLPEHAQVEPGGIPRVLQALEGCDLAVGRRVPLREPAARRLQAGLFHRLVERLFGVELADIGCRLRACRRNLLEECGAYGTQYRFLPLIAAARGFRVEEVAVAPGANGHYARLRPLDYARRLLDVLALFLLLRFTMRPLRFFGPIGTAILTPGILVTAMVVVSRLLLEVPLADRPALVLGVLMIVLGLQVIALGLLGEIIVFANSRQLRGVPVERVVEREAVGRPVA
jgi:glycosyltransferase involved in cell wall biosynthesis